MKHIRTLAFFAASVALLAACSSTPPASPPVAAAPPVPAQAPVAPQPAAPMQSTPVAAPKSDAMALPAYLDPKNPIATQRSVYFDFDVYTVKPEFAQMLEMHGKFLATNPGVKIKVEGHADERGGAEYNLALGQKRADAVVRALKIYGVKDAQMESISFGKEKPKATGHDEAAWAQNRRVDLAYPSK